MGMTREEQAIIALGDGIKDLVEQEKGWKHE